MRHLLRETEVAEIMGKAIQTLRNDRFKGRGLNYIKLGRSVRYDPEDVKAYIERRIKNKTDRRGPAPPKV